MGGIYESAPPPDSKTPFRAMSNPAKAPLGAFFSSTRAP